jgi:hypothetical protein
MIINL